MAAAGTIHAKEARIIAEVLEAAAGGERRESELLTVARTAEILGCCRKTVLRMADEGVLTRVQLRPGSTKSLRFRRREVLEVVSGGQREDG
jgi:excisionase family DNA binding protein